MAKAQEYYQHCNNSLTKYLGQNDDLSKKIQKKIKNFNYRLELKQQQILNPFSVQKVKVGRKSIDIFQKRNSMTQN